MKIIMITGFLGSGKTTLMQNILTRFGGSLKAGVIVNDFGKENIDAKLLDEDGITMAELSNGSIFCACIKDKFVDSLVAMSHRDLDYIFIEASGLADPSNMGTILQGIRHETNDSLEMKGSICVADAQTFADIYNLLPAVERQITHADMVLVNKKSMVDDETLRSIHEIIRAHNEDAEIYDTDFCKIDLQHLVFEVNNNKEMMQETTNEYATRVMTIVLKGEKPLKKEQLEDLVNTAVTSTYRIKGFAQTDEGCMSISCTMKNINIVPWKDEEATDIVFVSSVGIQLISVISGWLHNNSDSGLHIS